MTDLPDIKIKALVSFPANALGGTGIDITKSNGHYVIDLAYNDFGAPVGMLPPLTYQNVLLWDHIAGQYALTPISLLGSVGVPEAPNDGVQYGRQSLGWTPVASSSGGVPSNNNPVMDGVAAPGVAITYSRGDHVPPSDTSKAALTQVREKLTAARTYYVRIDGNNANNGLANTAGGAFLTIQKAVDATAVLDINGFGVTIQVGDGAYSAGATISKPFIGGDVSLLGNLTTPANVAVTVNSESVFRVFNNATIVIKGFKVSTTGSVGAGLYAIFGGLIIADKMNFGPCIGDHVEAADQGFIQLFNGSYTISGGAIGHWHAHGGHIIASYSTITITGTPAFGTYFAGIAAGTIQCQNNIFTGAATGRKFLIHYLGFILTNTNGDLNYLPGSTAGTLEDGGLYDNRFNGGWHTDIVIDAPGWSMLHFQQAGVTGMNVYDTGTNFIIANAAGTAGMYIVHGASAWSAISDKRLKAKANARDVTVLDKLASVRLVEYGDNYREIGVIAQEFAEAFPHLVHAGNDDDREIESMTEPGSWSMMYERAGVIALQGLKEAAAQIVELRSEIDGLKQDKS